MKFLTKGRKQTNYQQVSIMLIRPKRPELQSYESRLQTFDNWPVDFFRKEDVAAEGFYYTGNADCTRCFSCGGAVRNWQPEDDILLEHARWFPCCPFVEEKLDRETLEIVCNMHKNKEKITRITVNREIQRLQQLGNRDGEINDMDTSSDE